MPFELINFFSIAKSMWNYQSPGINIKYSTMLMSLDVKRYEIKNFFSPFFEYIITILILYSK